MSKLVMGLVAVLMIMTSCTGDGDDSSNAGNAEVSVVSAGAGGGSTTPTTQSASPETTAAPTTSAPTTAAPTTAAPTTQAPTTAPPTTASPTTASDGTIFRAESASFTSPSGNIACSLSSSRGVSCYIAEKQWTIEQPAGCDDGDFGNAIDLGPDGATFSCYTDFAWNLNAPPLAYGDASAAGEYICESDETGVTCTNGDRLGFKIARARVDVF